MDTTLGHRIKTDYKDPTSPAVRSELVCRSIAKAKCSALDPATASNGHLKHLKDNRG